MGEPKVRFRAGPRTRWTLATAVVLLALVYASTWIPAPLPDICPGPRVLSRPHQILPGQDIEATGLERRLARLRYTRARADPPGPGTYRADDWRLLLHRRPFKAGDTEYPAALVEIHFDRKGRIGSVRSKSGKPLGEFLLEPEVLGSFGEAQFTEQEPVQLGVLPPHVIDAVLVVEDRRFFDHGGLDLRRTAGALLANLKAGTVRQGGSTITQQLAKNVFLSHERTLARKIREAWYALRIERGASKEEILEAYLNTVYLGQRGATSVLGIEAAARHYFGKSASSLTVGEAALLVGMIRGPGLYQPFTRPGRARKRRDQVLVQLRDEGHLSVDAYEAAASESLEVVEASSDPVEAPYFIAKLERDLRSAPGGAEALAPGSVIYTGLDPELQHHATRAVQEGLRQLEAELPELRRSEQPLQAALIALDPHTDDIVALVGGRDWARSQFDRATQARRQPGSVFKPIVALAALVRGDEGRPRFTLASLLEDAPLEVETREGLWTPANYRGTFQGRITLRRAIEDSVNVPIARVGLELGPETLVATARRLGIDSPLAAVPSLSLGAAEVSPLEIARAYGQLAAGGRPVEARSFLHVSTAQGDSIPPVPTAERASFDAAEVSLVTSALRGAVARGTGKGIRALGYRGPVAGKTGTTNDFRDAWFAGYTPELAVAVWVGFDDGASTGLTGARGALPIFTRFLIRALGRDGFRDFKRPRGLEEVSINEASGLRASLFCWGRRELFLVGTAPRQRCDGRRIETARRPERSSTAQRPAPRRRQPDPIKHLLDAVVGAVEEVLGDR